MAEKTPEEIQKMLRGSGVATIFMGVLSVPLLDIARPSIVPIYVAVIALCAIGGIALLLKPSVLYGNICGLALLILALFDYQMGVGGGASPIAPIANIVIALFVFNEAAKLKKALTQGDTPADTPGDAQGGAQ